VGYARLQLNAGIVTAQTGTIDATKRSFRLVVDAVLGAAFHGTIVTEAYHVRPQGHQAFSRGETLQLIGALRYFADARGCAWHDVPAGDPDRELELLGLSRFIARWQELWPNARAAAWHHARSAWRALGFHLVKARPDLLLHLQDVTRFKILRPEERALHDHYAPIITWRFHGADRAREAGTDRRADPSA
jgi:hypothetical protein